MAAASVYCEVSIGERLKHNPLFKLGMQHVTSDSSLSSATQPVKTSFPQNKRNTLNFLPVNDLIIAIERDLHLWWCTTKLYWPNISNIRNCQTPLQTVRSHQSMLQTQEEIGTFPLYLFSSMCVWGLMHWSSHAGVIWWTADGAYRSVFPLRAFPADCKSH